MTRPTARPTTAPIRLTPLLLAALLALLWPPAHAHGQLNHPFADIAGGEWSAFIARVDSDEPDSGVFAYASVVDNSTDDAFFVRGVKRPTPDEWSTAASRGGICTTITP